MTTESDNSQPAVSVVIPTYNRASLLKEALDSVVAQTLQSWEVLVIDNYSTDDTGDIVASFGDTRIQRIRFSKDRLIAASRNEGVREARASLIAFLDSDDFWYPRKLEVSLKTLAMGYDVVCHNERFAFVGHGLGKRTIGKKADVRFRDLLLVRNTLSPSAVTMRRAVFEAAGGFSEDPEINTAEDYDLWLRLARMGASIKLIPEEDLGAYRIHGSNSSAAISRHRDAVRKVVTTHFLSIPSRTALDKVLFERRLAYIDCGAARGCIKAREFKSAFKYIKSVLLNGMSALRIVLSMLVAEQQRPTGRSPRA